MDDGKEIPDIIVDAGTRTTYKKGRFFGKVRVRLCNWKDEWRLRVNRYWVS